MGNIFSPFGWRYYQEIVHVSTQTKSKCTIHTECKFERLFKQYILYKNKKEERGYCGPCIYDMCEKCLVTLLDLDAISYDRIHPWIRTLIPKLEDEDEYFCSDCQKIICPNCKEIFLSEMEDNGIKHYKIDESVTRHLKSLGY